MSTTSEKQAPSTPAAKAPSKVGRKKNPTLAILDEELDRAAQAERSSEEAGPSASKRPAKVQGPIKKAKRRKEIPIVDQEEREKSSDNDTSDSEEGSDSEATSSDSSVQSDQPRKQLKKSGFITFKNVGLISPDSKSRLRQTQKLLESVANLIPRIDREGKDALRTFAGEVAEFRDFVKELISSTKSEVPDRNPLKSRVVKNLKTLRDCLIELWEDLDPNSEMPMFGSHILDWSDQPALREILGTKTARRLRTSLKGQKKLYKPIFKKSPADIARNWLSQQERRRTNFSSQSASYSRDSRPKHQDRNQDRYQDRNEYNKGSGFGKKRGGKR